MKRILYTLLILAVCGCASKRGIVPAVETHERTHTEDNARIHAERDSTHIVDSVRERTIHDTVYIEHIRKEYHDRFVGDTIHDSIYTAVHDSVPYPVPGPTEYIRQRNGYDKFTSWGFWLLLAGIAIGFVGKKKGWWRIVWGVLKSVF